MAERTNEEWVNDLQPSSPHHSAAIEDLRRLLERGLFYYLRGDRSDLSDRSPEELEQMAQDFTQDALLKILDKIDTFRGESKFTTWATKVAARVAISELRRVRYKNYSLDTLTASGEIMPSVSSSLTVSPEASPPPENFTERQEVLGLLDEAFRTILTDRQRTALSAYILDDIPVEEIARRLDTNRNALYKLVHDARLKLKRHLQTQGISLDYMLNLFEDR